MTPTRAPGVRDVGNESSAPAAPPLAPILANLRRAPSRTWSLIVTVYGDAILPRGGSVWLGTLLNFFQALDIGEGVVRTAMSRLAADGWLERTRVGRNSFYRLRSKGRAPFEEAARRIYARRPNPSPSARFELYIPDHPARGGTNMEEGGCGAIAPGVWISPRPLDIAGLRLRLEGDPETLRALAARAWPLEKLGASYVRFAAAFTPLRDFLAAGGVCSDIDAFCARILLIHEYRRIVLRDPLLPSSVLPPDWPGETARALCAEIYLAVCSASEAWLDANAIGEAGEALPTNESVFARFST